MFFPTLQVGFAVQPDGMDGLFGRLAGFSELLAFRLACSARSVQFSPSNCRVGENLHRRQREVLVAADLHLRVLPAIGVDHLVNQPPEQAGLADHVAGRVQMASIARR